MSKRKHSMTEASANIPTAKASRQKTSEHNADIEAVKQSINLLVDNCTLKRSSHDEYMKQIATALDHVNNVNSTLLIARANALGHQAKFSAAMEDALKAIELQPKSVQSYLTAAKLYSMQGKQVLASRILQDAYAAVSENERVLLGKPYARVKRKLNLKVDFVAKLPPEITASIFYHLISDIPTLVDCADVSRRWHDCVVRQCSGHFPKISVSNTETPNSKSHLLPIVCGDIQELSVNCTDQHKIEYLATMAAHGMFPSVKSLSIKFGESANGSVRAHQLLLITSLGSKLTTLSINLMEAGYQLPFPLDRVLKECINLTRLDLVSACPILYELPQASNFKGYKLEQLRIVTMDGEDLLKLLIRLCPKLQLLCMSEDSPEIVRLVDRYCPFIQHLSIAYTSWSYDTIPETNLPLTKGLRYIHIPDIYSSTLVPMLPLLEKSRDTLETIDISVHREDAAEPGLLDRYASLGFSELKNLHIRLISENGYFTQALPSILLQCPMLETVKLDFQFTDIPDNFFASLTVQPLLRNLRISNLHSTAAGVDTLLEHHASGDIPSVLQCVTISHSTGLTDSILSALGKITTVTDISLKSCTGTVSADGMAAFVQKLQTNEQLQGLTLEEVPYITDDVLLHLAKLSQLHTLTLVSLPSITSQAVRTLSASLYKSQSFKKLSISDCESVRG